MGQRIASIRRWVMGFLTVCACALSFEGNTTVAYADDIVHMSAVVGFNGFYSKQQWIPVSLTIDKQGAAKDVELSVDSDFPISDNRYAEGGLHWTAHVAGHGEHTQITIPVPGPVVDREAVILCTIGGQVVASARLSGTALGNVALVATLSRREQAPQFLAGASNGPSGNPVLPVSIATAGLLGSTNTLPPSPNLLSGLTAVTVDPHTLSLLSAADKKTLYTWVNLGGLLIVTGTGGVSGWNTMLPLVPGPVHKESGTPLAQFLGDSVTPPKDFDVAVKGALPRSTVWVGTASDPIVASLKVGRGTVMQTAFQPPELSAWPSNAALWTQLLGMGNTDGWTALPPLLSMDKTLQLVTASDSLSPLKIPSLDFWASVFVIYALVVGPLSFFILRRRKRETWAWVMLPVVSVVTTVGIYVFGANQRPSGMLTEGVGVLDLVGDGSAESYGIRAFTSPLDTTASVTTPQHMLVLPLAQRNVQELGTASVIYRGNTWATFDNVGRWGVRYVYAAGAVEEQGKLSSSLWATLGTLTGEVTNNTPYALNNIAACWNGKIYQLGDLKPGETVGINQDTKSQSASNYLSAYGSYNRDIMHGIGRPIGTLAATQGMFPQTDAMAVGEVMLVATTTEQTPALPEVVAGQPTTEDNDLVLVRQFASVTEYPNSGVTSH